jgi:hypothetical protein
MEKGPPLVVIFFCRVFAAPLWSETIGYDMAPLISRRARDDQG